MAIRFEMAPIVNFSDISRGLLTEDFDSLQDAWPNEHLWFDTDERTLAQKRQELTLAIYDEDVAKRVSNDITLIELLRANGFETGVIIHI